MNVLTFSYDETYMPAFPVVQVEIEGYDATRGRQTITALVDSGADGTMIPLDVLEAVGATYEDTVPMRGVAGGVQRVDRYTIAVQVGTHVVQAIHAVAIIPNGEAIIGRDVLNELIMILNGPAHTTEIQIP